MSLAINVLAGIGSILLFGFVIYFVINIYYKDKDDEKVMVECFAPKYCKGKNFGVFKEKIYGKDNRVGIIYNHLEEDIIVWADRGQVIEQSKGLYNRERGFIHILPSRAEDYSEVFNEKFKALGITSEITDAINTERDMVREGSKRKTNILKKLGDREASSEYLNKIEAETDDRMKIIAKEKDGGKNSSFGGTNPYNGGS